MTEIRLMMKFGFWVALVGCGIGMCAFSPSALAAPALDEPAPVASARNFIVTPRLGAGATFQGLAEPPVANDVAFVISGGMATGFRITTVEHFPWYAPIAWPVCPDGDDIFCPSMAGPVPHDAEFKVWLFENGQLRHQQSFPGFGLQFDAGHAVEVAYPLVDGAVYTVLAGYLTQECATPPCVVQPAKLFWRLPDQFDQEQYVIQDTLTTDWPDNWQTGGGFATPPAALSFYYDSRPLEPGFAATSQWAEWPAGSGQMATNYGSWLELQNAAYISVTWSLTGPQSYVASPLTQGQPPFRYQLPDLAGDPNLAGVDSGFQIQVEVMNAYGLSGEETVALGSFRGLRFDAVTWNIHYENLGQGNPDKHQWGIPTQRQGRRDEPSCFVPDPNRQQHTVFEIDQWGAHSQNLAQPGDDYRFQAGVLLTWRNGDTTVHNPVLTSNISSNNLMRATAFNILQNYDWHVNGNGTSEYPYGDYIELALFQVEDTRSGKVRNDPNGTSTSAGIWMNQPYHEHRLRLHRQFGNNIPCLAPSSLTFLHSNNAADVANQYSFTPGDDLPIWFLPQFDQVVFDPLDPHDRIDYLRVKFLQDDQDLGLSFTHPWSVCDSNQTNPALANGVIESLSLPGSLALPSGTLTLVIEACNERAIHQNNNCDNLPVRITGSIPLFVGAAPPTGELTSFALITNGGSQAQVDTATGAVNFWFETTDDGLPAQHLEWRWWRDNGGNDQYWYEGQWTAANDGFHTVGPAATDEFSLSWLWLQTPGTLQTVRPPFVPLLWVDNFFDTGTLQTVSVEVRLRYPDNSLSNTLSHTFTVEAEAPPDPTIDLVALQASVDGGTWSGTSVSYSEGEVASLGLRITTTDTVDLSAQLANFNYELRDQNGTPLINCEGVTLDFTASYDASGAPIFYRLTPTGNLRNQLDQRGAYRLVIFPQAGACAGAVDRLSVDLNVNPPASDPQTRLVIRLHFRDHLGTSLVSKAFRVEAPAGGALGTISLDLGDGPLTLHGHPPEYHFHEPFGQPLAVAADNTDAPRYTDHEHDPFTDFHYMKARYQLAAHGIFNRPDPMRDWDRENPYSINLYQYVRNDPLNSWDPDGFCKGPCTKDHNRGNSKAGAREIIRRVAISRGQDPDTAEANFMARVRSGPGAGDYAQMLASELFPASETVFIANDVRQNGFSEGTAVDIVFAVLPGAPNGVGRLSRKAGQAADAKKVERSVGGGGGGNSVGGSGGAGGGSGDDAISMDDALQQASDFMEPGVPIKSTESLSGIQFIQAFSDAEGNAIVKRAGFDLNPDSSHVQKLGPHLNLQTQKNGKIIKSGPLKDPHTPIAPDTIRPTDY